MGSRAGKTEEIPEENDVNLAYGTLSPDVVRGQE